MDLPNKRVMSTENMTEIIQPKRPNDSLSALAHTKAQIENEKLKMKIFLSIGQHPFRFVG